MTSERINAHVTVNNRHFKESFVLSNPSIGMILAYILIPLWFVGTGLVGDFKRFMVIAEHGSPGKRQEPYRTYLASL